MNIAAVPAAMVELIWDQCEPHIQAVINKAPDELVMDKIYDSLVEGKTMLVVITEGSEVVAVNVLDVRTLDSGVRCLYIPITGGSRMNEWLDYFFILVEAIAKDMGCTKLRGIAVRKGWLRKLQGWHAVHTVIEKDLQEKI